VAASFYQAFPNPKNPSGIDAVVHSFAVYEEYRGKGIGRKLFSRILKECRQRGVGCIALYATDMGQPIYESFGFSHEVIVCPEMRLYYRDLVELDL
jgi:GNAT superfamily N-acetyltransferase